MEMNQPELTKEQMDKVRRVLQLIADTLVKEKFKRLEVALLIGLLIDISKRTDEEFKK